MKKLLFIFVFAPLFAKSQKLITLHDTAFSKGDILREYLAFEYDKPVITASGKPRLDSIADFLLRHKNLIIEVGQHLDARYNPRYSTQLDKRRARYLVEYLVTKGVDASQLVYRGYADTIPVISEDEIKKLKTKEEQELAHQKNRRTEFKIIKINQ